MTVQFAKGVVLAILQYCTES